MLSGLASVVAAEKIDAVLVAGDVYDRAVPSADATAVLDRVVERLLKAGAAVVMTPGNHDSARRLGTFSGLLSAAGLHVRAGHEPARRARPALRRARRRRGVRPAVPRAGGGPARAGAGRWPDRESQPRGGAGRGHGSRPRRPVPPPRSALGGARARLRRRRGGQRERAGHLRRRRRPRAGIGLRRRRLRRARAPAPAADAHAAAALQRLAPGLLLRRGRSAEAGLAGRARRAPASPTSGPCRCRPRGG